MERKEFRVEYKKMELDILTFAHGAYRDKKAVLSFSSGKPEVNVPVRKSLLILFFFSTSLKTVTNKTKSNEKGYFTELKLSNVAWRT